MALKLQATKTYIPCPGIQGFNLLFALEWYCSQHTHKCTYTQMCHSSVSQTHSCLYHNYICVYNSLSVPPTSPNWQVGSTHSRDPLSLTVTVPSAYLQNLSESPNSHASPEIAVCIYLYRLLLYNGSLRASKDSTLYINGSHNPVLQNKFIPTHWINKWFCLQRHSQNTACLKNETYGRVKESWETIAWNTEKVTNLKWWLYPQT